MRYVLIFLIRGYQLVISPLFPPSCRFFPSCSEYAKQSLEMHGILRGGALTAWRLLRCHPFCAGGLDPVPEPGPPRATVPPPANMPSRTVVANLNTPNS